ncbi:Phospholipase/carboxylesterase [Obba rivulosa]|uniref:Acyl-protein thioesterase 1 n=1 Tax=Obba rivulosa TaxID=1052685 RepID=A0A8E2B511_9APHY|nr:Phospholipase/carboxylesterase [Obba rivulosa]
MLNGGPVDQLIPPTGDHKGTVIFLHGLGQFAETWYPTIERMAARLPNVKWVCPQAPLRPVTLNQGAYRPSWFDIANLPPCDFYDDQGTAASVGTVESLIQAETRLGLDSRKVVVVGFSQGAALALIASLTTLHYLGGVASLSGWIPQASRQMMVHLEPNLPIFWGHGTQDPEVPLSMGQECITFLRNTLHIPDEKVKFKPYESMGHAVNEQELDDLVDWLSSVLD